MRQPYQVIVFPYTKTGDGYLFAVFKRKEPVFWQAISGGGEDDETPIETAKREAFEEVGLEPTLTYIKLDAMTTIPFVHVGNYTWGEGVFVLPEYSFGVEVVSQELNIDSEHSEYRWLPYEEARELLKYDSNKTALWELHYRLTGK